MNYTKLNPDFKKRWIEALRSGDYEQGKNSLYKDGKYCCLGVACVLDGISTDVIEKRPYITGAMKPSEDLVQLSKNDISSTKDLDYVLSDMNDERGISFEGIANWIEDNL